MARVVITLGRRNSKKAFFTPCVATAPKASKRRGPSYHGPRRVAGACRSPQPAVDSDSHLYPPCMPARWRVHEALCFVSVVDDGSVIAREIRADSGWQLPLLWQGQVAAVRGPLQPATLLRLRARRHRQAWRDEPGRETRLLAESLSPPGMAAF